MNTCMEVRWRNWRRVTARGIVSPWSEELEIIENIWFWQDFETLKSIDYSLQDRKRSWIQVSVRDAYTQILRRPLKWMHKRMKDRLDLPTGLYLSSICQVENRLLKHEYHTVHPKIPLWNHINCLQGISFDILSEPRSGTITGSGIKIFRSFFSLIEAMVVGSVETGKPRTAHENNLSKGPS